MNTTTEFKQYDEFTNRTVHLVFEEDGVSIEELCEQFKSFLLAIGYHPDTIADHIVND